MQIAHWSHPCFLHLRPRKACNGVIAQLLSFFRDSRRPDPFVSIQGIWGLRTTVFEIHDFSPANELPHCAVPTPALPP